MNAEHKSPTVARVGKGAPASRAEACARLKAKNDSTLKIGKQKKTKLSRPHINARLAACSVAPCSFTFSTATCAFSAACCWARCAASAASAARAAPETVPQYPHWSVFGRQTRAAALTSEHGPAPGYPAHPTPRKSRARAGQDRPETPK